MNLSAIVCPILLEKKHFHFYLGVDLLEFTFSLDLEFSKTHLLLKLILRATELRQKFNFATDQKIKFFNLASSTNLVVKAVLLQQGSIYDKV